MLCVICRSPLVWVLPISIDSIIIPHFHQTVNKSVLILCNSNKMHADKNNERTRYNAKKSIIGFLVYARATKNEQILMYINIYVKKI